MKKAAQPSPPQPLSLRLVNRVLQLPRFSRIVLAILFALAVTLAVTPIIDGVYLNSFYDESTRIAPSLVSTALGIVFYFVGWRLIVGYAGEEPQPRPVVFFYVIGGILLVIIVFILVVFGAITGSIQ